MNVNMRSDALTAPGPTSGHAALILERLIERRSLLAQHNPEALPLTAEVLAPIHETAHGHAAELRCDRTGRVRIAQLMGEKPLAVEDLAAMALENSRGRSAVLAGLRVLAQALGYELRPVNARVEGLHEAVALSMEGCASLWAGVSRAVADGKFEPHEAADLEPVLSEAQERLTALRAAMKHAAAQPFYRRVQPVSRG